MWKKTGDVFVTTVSQRHLVKVNDALYVICPAILSNDWQPGYALLRWLENGQLDVLEFWTESQKNPCPALFWRHLNRFWVVATSLATVAETDDNRYSFYAALHNQKRMPGYVLLRESIGQITEESILGWWDYLGQPEWIDLRGVPDQIINEVCVRIEHLLGSGQD